jgi:hypothetical protein
LNSLVKVLLVIKKNLILLSKALGKECPFHVPQNGAPHENIQNESVFGYGRFLGEGFNSKFFFDCHNTIIYIAIRIYLFLVASFMEFHKI